MSHKVTLIALLISLLFATQAPIASAGSQDVKPKCTLGCCADLTCCVRSGDQPVPRTPAPVVPRSDLQITAVELHALPLLYTFPVEERPFVIIDKVRAGHALPPRLAGCIQLI